MDIICPYCNKEKSSIEDRTFSLFTSSDKVIYVRSCEDCFNTMGERLVESYREYYREICSDN